MPHFSVQLSHFKLPCPTFPFTLARQKGLNSFYSSVFWGATSHYYSLSVSAAMQIKSLKVLTVVDSIVIVGMLTCCELVFLWMILKAAQINMQCSWTWEFMLYKFLQAITPQNQPKIFDVEKVKDSSKFTEQHLESIRWGQYLSIQCVSLHSQPWLNHPELPNCISHYQIIAKLLTHPSIFISFW